ncbi:MAG: hypothetical protein AAF937_07955 [Planctomycetota bacterium]
MPAVSLVANNPTDLATQTLGGRESISIPSLAQLVEAARLVASFAAADLRALPETRGHHSAQPPAPRGVDTVEISDAARRAAAA